MDQRRVVSREYKIMLRANRFHGDERALLQQAREFWRAFSSAVSRIVIRADGSFHDVRPPRLITFLDTRDRRLNGGGYIFRERQGVDGGAREVTLKFRHPDRHVAQDRDMSASHPRRARTKFEEDIKGPFVSLYSFSTTVGDVDDRKFATAKDVRHLFRDLDERLDGFGGARPIAAVNGFTARELVVTGGFLTIGRHPHITAESALIVWYNHAARQRERPVAVEFSYRYGNDDEQYDGTMSGRAFSVFNVLQTKLDAWVAPKGGTKTALVYR